MYKNVKSCIYLNVYSEPPLCMDTTVPEPCQPGVTVTVNARIWEDQNGHSGSEASDTKFPYYDFLCLGELPCCTEQYLLYLQGIPFIKFKTNQISPLTLSPSVDLMPQDHLRQQGAVLKESHLFLDYLNCHFLACHFAGWSKHSGDC